MTSQRVERPGCGPALPKTTVGLLAPMEAVPCTAPRQPPRPPPRRDPAVPICADGLGDSADIYESVDGDDDRPHG
jgi:hypothetical protein